MSDDTPLKAAPPSRNWILTLFAAIGVMGILGVILIAIFLFAETRHYQPAKVANETGKTIFTIHSVQPLEGTSLIRMSVATSASGGNPYGSYSAREDDTRNILLFDKAKGTTRKLLPDNRRRVIEAQFLSAKGDLVSDDLALLAMTEDRVPEERAPPAYFALTVANAADPRLQDVLVGSLASGAQAFVMQGIEGIDQTWMHGPTQIAFLVREKLALYYRIVDIPSLKVVGSRRVEID